MDRELATVGKFDWTALRMIVRMELDRFVVVDGYMDGGWNRMDWIGSDWNGLEWNGMEWNGMEWIGLDWIGLDWIGLDWIVDMYGGKGDGWVFRGLIGYGFFRLLRLLALVWGGLYGWCCGGLVFWWLGDDGDGDGGDGGDGDDGDGHGDGHGDGDGDGSDGLGSWTVGVSFSTQSF